MTKLLLNLDVISDASPFSEVLTIKRVAVMTKKPIRKPATGKAGRLRLRASGSAKPGTKPLALMKTLRVLPSVRIVEDRDYLPEPVPLT